MSFALRPLVAVRRYAALNNAQPSGRRDGATLIPSVFPHDLKLRPGLAGENRVYDALANALPAGWTVFYNARIPRSRRSIDFLIVVPKRGLVAIEVKGGLVHMRRGAMRQAQRRTPLQGKRIQPFLQLQRALADLWRATNLPPGAVPTHLIAAFPHMSAKAYPWGPAQHVLTREDLDPECLGARLRNALPPLQGPEPKLDTLIAMLSSVPSRAPKRRRKTSKL
ncbi:MAG: nuclease-related domain-containing protein [Hyphomicrobium sp.]